MKLAIHYIYWQTDLQCKSYMPYVEKAKCLGFDALELGDYLILRLSDAEIDALRRASEEFGIELTLGIDPPQDIALTAFDPDARGKGVAFYTDLIPKLERLGVRRLGGNLLNGAPVLPYKDNFEREWALGVDSVRRIARRAADTGILVNVEITNRFENHLLNTALRGAAFAREVDEANMGILLDTFHMNIEEVSIGDAIRAAGKHLGHFHLGENHRGLPGSGHLDWDEIVAALREIGYEGVLAMEPLVHAQCELGDCCRVWNDLTGFADERKLDRDAAASASFMRRVWARHS